MQIDGRCHCGAVAYEADVDRDQVFLCHCEDCQVFSGDPFPISISGGTVRQKSSLEPVLQAWCCSRLPWVGRLAAIPDLDRQDVSAVRPAWEPRAENRR